jgi:cytochrome b561
VIALLTALGFFLGVLVGFVLRDASELIRSRKESPMPFSTPAHRVMTMGLILSIVLVSIVGALLVVTRKSANDYFTCTADWQQQFGKAYKARAEATIAVETALDAVVRAVATQNREAFKRAVAEYVRLRDDQTEERRTNPLPQLPAQLCGKPEEVRR